MGKEILTEKKAKNTPQGGVLVGKRKGQTIIHDAGTQGGYFVGKLHSEGGIKGVNKTTGQPIEVQGGEVIITAPAVADQTKRNFNGEMLTNRQILSKINEKGGGVSFADGGDIPSEVYFNGSSYEFGGESLSDYEIMRKMNDCGCEHEYEGGGMSDGKSLQDIADMHNVSLQSIKKELAKGKKVESEHTNDKKLVEKIAKDHLVENPKYYTILDKVGLEKGGYFKDGGYVSYKDKYNKKYKYSKGTSHSLEEISKDTGVSLKGLQKIYNKGIGAYKTNPESVRPSVKSKEQWAMARVYSSVMGGKASKVDSNELKMKKGGGVDLIKEDIKTKAPRDFSPNTYDDVMDIHADGVVGGETGFELGDAVAGVDTIFENGGDLDFLEEAVQKFDDGGSTTNEVESIILESGTYGYFTEMPKKEYTSFKDFVSDLQSVFISENKSSGYFYFSIYKNGNKIIPTRLAIQFKNSKNTVLNFNPLTGKYSDFKKQIERRYGATIKRNNLDFSKWLTGKSAPQPQPEPQPIKEKAIRVRFAIVENNSVIAEDSFYYVSAFFEYLKVFENKDVKVIIDLEKIGGTYIANNSFYLQKENENIRQFNIDEVPLYILERFFVNYFPEVDLSELFGGKEKVPKKMSLQELEDFFNKKTEPKKEEPKVVAKIDFGATKKYLFSRINDLTKELNFKKPSLSNEEIGFYQRDINNLIEKLRVVNEKELDGMDYSLRLSEAYSLKWGDIKSEYKPADVLAPNGLPTKLTSQEWSNVRSDYFSSFFGDWMLANETGDFSGVSKVIDPETKEPMPVYHGTNVLFTEWKTYKTNNAHYFAKNRDFSEWFAEQWEKGRSDVSAKDSKLLKALNPDKGTYLYRCFLDIKNPIDFSRFGVEKRPVSDFILFLKINYNIGDFDFWTNFTLFNSLTQDTLVYSWMIIRNWQSFTEYIKMATTYDGYIFYEYHPEKVGTGLDGASLSFCAFDSSQIKFTNATEFNALITDSRFEQGGKL